VKSTRDPDVDVRIDDDLTGVLYGDERFVALVDIPGEVIGLRLHPQNRLADEVERACDVLVEMRRAR